MRISTAILSLSLLAFSSSESVASAADREFRSGQPEVLSAPAPQPVADDSEQLMAAFAEAYSARREPRIVLFWNRALTDQLKEVKKTEKIRKKETGGGKTVESQDDGSGGSVEESTVHQSEVVRERVEETSIDTATRDGPDERFAWTLEDAVVRALTAMGARVVDRSAAMRFAVAEQGIDGRAADKVQVETFALLQKGDLLLEILMTDDPRSPTRALYRILVKEMGSGRVLASAVTDARPPLPAGKPRFRVGPNGYERVAPAEAMVADVARQLSKHVVRALVAGLTR